MAFINCLNQCSKMANRQKLQPTGPMAAKEMWSCTCGQRFKATHFNLHRQADRVIGRRVRNLPYGGLHFIPLTA
ncbi:hypothetical protein VFPPC_15073 [Pochonia chlamydosporia 170]|uniref:Uncharacterized protein n=1 Tax=Pochonia chlamydosporia 170 TaxID=1380566 RepID=A0A179G2R0_METCM|nr:hypothetical protein VFPPC_15073 [Pochonia chlamydosporia 170]OAQ72152.1 hypothetical protein VFPPC_15073 [Pochonia chlamydosporia 170]